MTETPPDTMRLIGADGSGGPEVLSLTEGPVPRPAAGEVLIRVAAAGVNRPDLLQRQGLYPPPPGASPILGLEAAGTIAELGAGVADWQVGDPVCALLAGGGYAEFCAVPAVQCLPVPAGFSMVEAAALPETFFTVWANVFDRGRLRAGETVLIHGGTSGIGTTAIQLAKAFGASVLTTAGSDAKTAACLRLGADRAINYRTEDFLDVVRSATGGRGADVILDMVGGPYLARNLRCLAVEGRLVVIAVQGGAKAEIDLMHLMLKRQTVTGSTLRARSAADKGVLAAALRDKVWPLLAARTVAPVIHATLPLAAAAGAHRLLEAGEHIGKVVLTVAG